MLLVLPYGTDAAIDHRPFGTALLIAANVAVAVLLGFPGEGEGILGGRLVDDWVLEFGELSPLQWITSVFVHAGWIHLAGNMIFLWLFGLIVEGYLGWWRFLPLYLAVGMGECAVEQIVMLGASSGGAVGASGAISGLMAIAALWAPRNRVRFVLCVFLFWVRTVPRTHLVEWSVLAFCGVWIGLDLLFVLLTGFAVSGALFHVIGAAVGLGLGILMLEKRWVDCEGWDYLSLRAAGAPGRVRLTEEELRPRRPKGQRGGTLETDARAQALVRFRDALERCEPLEADVILRKARRRAPGWLPPRADLLRLIELLLRVPAGEALFERMEQFLQAYPDGSEPVRLTLADRLLRARRSGRAMEHLQRLRDDRLSPTQRAVRAELEGRAAQAAAVGDLELE